VSRLNVGTYRLFGKTYAYAVLIILTCGAGAYSSSAPLGLGFDTPM